jgi:ribosomal protein S18 acetylase RimI-like enzyme
MTCSFEAAGAADIDELMSWFPDAHSVDIWGGPRFRYPFDRASFHEDCRWQEYTSYCLREPGNRFAAFGQIGQRYKRSHLARLIAHPDLRGQGVGKRLLEKLIGIAREANECEEVALFVYRDNEPAYRCYRAMGFEVQEYPDDAPMRERCFYLSRPVA